MDIDYKYNPEVEPFGDRYKADRIKDLEMTISEMQRNMQILNQNSKSLQEAYSMLMLAYKSLETKFAKWPFIAPPKAD